MNIPAVLQAPDREGRKDRRIQNPEDHLLRRLFVGDGRLRRPDPAGHHLSRTLGLHLAAGPADLRRRRPGRRDPPAGGGARPRRAAVPERAARSRRAAGTAGLRRPTTARRAIPAAIPTTSSTTSAARASARSPAFAAPTAKATAAARPIETQLDAYIAGGCFHEHHLAPEQRYYKHANKAYLDWAKDMGFIGAAAPVTFQLYLEPLQKFRLAARGHGAVKPPATPSRAHREILRSDSVLVSAVRRRHGRARHFRRSRSGRCTCTTRGARTTAGSARSRRRTASTSTARARKSSASPTATGSGSRARSAASKAASG